MFFSSFNDHSSCHANVHFLIIIQPALTKEAANKISKAYTDLRDQENISNDKAKVMIGNCILYEYMYV